MHRYILLLAVTIATAVAAFVFNGPRVEAAAVAIPEPEFRDEDSSRIASNSRLYPRDDDDDGTSNGGSGKPKSPKGPKGGSGAAKKGSNGGGKGKGKGKGPVKQSSIGGGKGAKSASNPLDAGFVAPGDKGEDSDDAATLVGDPSDVGATSGASASSSSSSASSSASGSSSGAGKSGSKRKKPPLVKQKAATTAPLAALTEHQIFEAFLRARVPTTEAELADLEEGPGMTLLDQLHMHSYNPMLVKQGNTRRYFERAKATLKKYLDVALKVVSVIVGNKPFPARFSNTAVQTEIAKTGTSRTRKPPLSCRNSFRTPCKSSSETTSNSPKPTKPKNVSAAKAVHLLEKA